MKDMIGYVLLAAGVGGLLGGFAMVSRALTAGWAVAVVGAMLVLGSYKLLAGGAPRTS
ncbi:MAG: hypothetical protein KF819_29965 [Labilithrix sp.]|nr:hypothetical protein [Labilithrix sp.]